MLGIGRSPAAPKHRRRQKSVDPLSFQVPDERIEAALRKPALADLRDPCQDLVLRDAIAIGLDDEPPAAHVYLDRDADVKSGALEPAAPQD